MTGVRRWRWLAALAAVAIVVAGVAVLRTDDTPDPPGQPRVRIREGGTVRTTAIQEPSGFNPHTSKDGGGVALQAVDATMYPSVFRIHPDLSFRLDQTFMASAKLTSHNPQTITYQIRPEASWSDGTSISATDFHGTPPRPLEAAGSGCCRENVVPGFGARPIELRPPRSRVGLPGRPAYAGAAVGVQSAARVPPWAARESGRAGPRPARGCCPRRPVTPPDRPRRTSSRAAR